MAINLTKRQEEILGWILKGASNKHIAQRLNITESTVKLHTTILLKKYGVRNRLQLFASANNNVNVSLPADLEAKPFGWILTDGRNIKGMVTAREQPSEKWQPFYVRDIDDGQN